MVGDGRYLLDATTVRDDSPFLIYDTRGQPHAALIAFGRAVAATGQPAAARAYCYALLPFFTFLDTDPSQGAVGRRWDSPPGEVRAVVLDYLARNPRGQGFFLVGLRRFYRMQRAAGAYRHANPLAGSLPVPSEAPGPTVLTTGEPRAGAADVAVADPLLHARLLLAGRKVGWGLRERCVARIALESGAGLEVVLGLTLGDWLDRGMGREIVARGVGRDRRVRVLRVAPLTVRLLHQYGETARRLVDPAGLSLAERRLLVAAEGADPDRVPLFLTARGTPLRPATFRDRTWRPACARAGLVLEPRDARRWYATQVTRLIRETSAGAIAAELQCLAAYLRGVSGHGERDALLALAAATTAAHARAQDRFHARLGDDLGQALVAALRDAA